MGRPEGMEGARYCTRACTLHSSLSDAQPASTAPASRFALSPSPIPFPRWTLSGRCWWTSTWTAPMSWTWTRWRVRGPAISTFSCSTESDGMGWHGRRQGGLLCITW